MDFALPEEIAGLEAELVRFGERELRPRLRDLEAARALDDAVLKPLDAFALSGLDLPAEWGGTGSGALAKVVALEAVAFGDAGGIFAGDRCGPWAAAALACPDAVLAAKVAGAGLAGEARATLLVGDAMEIAWCPGDAAPRWTWLSDGGRLALLRTEGCAAREADAAAFHASGGVTVDLAGAETVGEWALGETASLTLRGRARLWPAAVSLGIARASLEYAVAYAKDRVVMGKPVAHHQGNAFAIAEARSNLDAARLAVRAAAERLDRGGADAGLWATLAWMDATEAAIELTDLGVQLLGGHGYIEDHPSEKWFREARALALLFGGRDAALDDAQAEVLDARDAVVAG